LSYWLATAMIRVMSGSALTSSADGRIADPFAPTADLVALLRVRAADMAARSGRRRDLLRRAGADPRRRPAFARG
jgi:hypothetical protein